MEADPKSTEPSASPGVSPRALHKSPRIATRQRSSSNESHPAASLHPKTSARRNSTDCNSLARLLAILPCLDFQVEKCSGPESASGHSVFNRLRIRKGSKKIHEKASDEKALAGPSKENHRFFPAFRRTSSNAKQILKTVEEVPDRAMKAAHSSSLPDLPMTRSATTYYEDYEIDDDSSSSEESMLPSSDSSTPQLPLKECPLLGYWKLQLNENWDAFLREAGVGILLRKITCEMTTFEEILLLGETWHIRMSSPLKNFESAFRLNEEFEEENFDGKKVKAIAKLNDRATVLTIEQTAMENGGLELLITREITQDDRLLCTVTSSQFDVIARRYFVRTT